MEDETNFMEFSVVDECGSDEGDDPDDEIQVLDEIGSSNPSKESDLFADMVVLDISTSPTKELEEVIEKSRSSHRSDRSNRYRDKRSPHRERSSRDKRSSNRESSRKDEEKRNNRRHDSRSKDRRQDRSRSKESRYKSSSDRHRRSREKEQEKSSSSKRSQNIPTKEASKRSQSSKQTERKDDTSSSTTKSSSKVHSKENQKSVKHKDSKEKLEKASVEKTETDGESEGEGISISTDDNIFSGINASDMSKSDFVTLTVVDEDVNEETNTKNISEKKTTLKSSDSYPAKYKKADVTEKTKTQSPQTASVDKRKTQQMQKMMKSVNEPASKIAIQEKEKAPLKVTNRLTEIFKPKSDSKKEVEMVVVEDIDELDKPLPKPLTSQRRPAKEDPNKFKVTEELFTVENVEDAGTRKPTKEDPNKFKVTEEMFSVETAKDTGKKKPTTEDPNKFKVTEELFTVKNVDKSNREVKIIGVDDLTLKHADKEERKDSSNKKETTAIKAEESKSVNKAQMIVVEDSAKMTNPQKNQGASPSPDQTKSVREVSSKVQITEGVLHVRSQKKTEQEVSIVNDGSSLEKKEEKTMTSVEMKDRKSENLKKDDVVKMEDKPQEKEPENETKLFEVPSINDEEGEEMEISIMDDLNVESKSSEISGETDEDVIEVIFSNGEEEEEMLLNSKTEFEDNFPKGTDQADKVYTSTNKDTQAKGNEQIDENEDSGSHNKEKIPSPQIANNEQNAVQEQEFKEIESPVEPDNVIEDGMEIIVLSDTEDEDSYHEHEMQYKDEENIDHNDNEYADMLADNKDKVENIEIEHTSRDAEDDGFIEDGTEITIEDEGSGIEAGDEDNLGEIDEDAFLAMMQSEGLTVEDADDAEDETRENSEQVDQATDSAQLLITVSQTSEKRDVKSSGDSQEKSELKSPIDRISSNLAKIRKEMDNASKQSKSGSKEDSSLEKDKARKSRERSKDRGSREPSKDKDEQKSKSSERDLRQVLKSKKSQGSRDLRDVIKERKAKEIDDGEPEQCLSEGEFVRGSSCDLALRFCSRALQFLLFSVIVVETYCICV